MSVSNRDIICKIETILSEILSKKHDAKITIKFVKAREKIQNGNSNTSRDFRKEQILD